MPLHDDTAAALQHHHALDCLLSSRAQGFCPGPPFQVHTPEEGGGAAGCVWLPAGRTPPALRAATKVQAHSLLPQCQCSQRRGQPSMQCKKWGSLLAGTTEPNHHPPAAAAQITGPPPMGGQSAQTPPHFAVLSALPPQQEPINPHRVNPVCCPFWAPRAAACATSCRRRRRPRRCWSWARAAPRRPHQQSCWCWGPPARAGWRRA